MALPWLMKVSHSTKGACACKTALATTIHNQASPMRRRGNISKDLQDDQREVVILCRAGGETIRARNHRGDDLLRGTIRNCPGGGDQLLFTPCLVIDRHGFTDAIGEGDEHVVR